jgi:hypoxanthine phosphoribosyltransferase
MEIITVKDKQFKPYITYNKIEDRVKELGRRINQDYEGKEPLFLAILNGSFMFAGDLFKYIDIDCSISFVKLASYKGTTSTGNVINLIGMDENVTGRHVVVLEDIVDTGRTLTDLLPGLKNQNPASLRVMSLLLKPESMQFDVPIYYTGFEIPNEFIVGYGLDYDGYGRNLKDIYQIVE